MFFFVFVILVFCFVFAFSRVKGEKVWKVQDTTAALFPQTTFSVNKNLYYFQHKKGKKKKSLF